MSKFVSSLHTYTLLVFKLKTDINQDIITGIRLSVYAKLYNKTKETLISKALFFKNPIITGESENECFHSTFPTDQLGL